MPARKVQTCAALLAAVSTLAWGAPAAAAETPGRVLVIYAYTRLLPAHVAFEKGLRDTLHASLDRPVEQYDEFLDTPRLDGPDYFGSVTRYLGEKYAAHPPDVLVAVGSEALRFLADHRDSLFPGVPVVHAAVEKRVLESLPPLPADFVGVAVEHDFAGTIAQALKWHPRARHLVLVTGQAKKDREWEEKLRHDAGAFEDRLSIDFLSALPTAELLRRLGALTTETIIFTPGFFQDGDGRNFTPQESIRMMTAASRAPVYTVFDTALDLGIVGGRMISFEAMGREAGREVRGLMAGATPANLSVPENLPSSLNIDWRQIERFGVDAKQIPAEAIVHFRASSIFEAYRAQVLLALGALLLQTLVIALLFEERRRRRAAETAEYQRRRELAHVSRLAVAGELLGSIAHEINQPLGAILANADAADLMLASGADRRTELAAILSDIRRDDLRASEVIRRLRALVARNEVERRPFDLLEAVREVESLVRSEARRRRVSLEVRSAAASTPKFSFVGDRTQIQQVVLNLVVNAMDAVGDLPEDRRAITIAVETGAEGFGISVRDRGQGISPEQVANLFDSFYTTKPQGMGLGLSISRTLVEAHGGRIRAESRPGDATTFHVWLPRVAPQPAAMEAG